MNRIWGNIDLLYPWVLLFLPGILLLGWWYWRRRKDFLPALPLPNAASVPMGLSLRAHLMNLLPWFRLLALAALLIALSRPRLVNTEEEVSAEAISIMLVMDLSSSMLATDFEPNRLEVSKEVAIEFVDKRPYDKVGLAVFAAEAYTQCPLTTDRKMLKDLLQQLEVGLLEDGTAIGEGLAVGVNRLRESDTESRVIILLTDGENNAGYVQPATAAEIAREFGVKVYTVGVGSFGQAYTPVRRNFDGTYSYALKMVNIDEDLLREIAETTGGKYYRATSSTALQQIYQEIDTLEKTEVEVSVVRRYRELFFPFALFAILIVSMEVLLRYGLLRPYP